MSELSQEEKNMMLLYGRSAKDAEGWADVSDQLWPHVQKYLNLAMFEVVGQKIRTTPAGDAVLQYAL